MRPGQQERAPVVRVGIFTATYLVSATIGSFVLGNWDLVANMIGASVAATLIYLGASRRSVEDRDSLESE